MPTATMRAASRYDILGLYLSAHRVGYYVNNNNIIRPVNSAVT